MGLPLNDTVVEERCSTGFEKVNGECIPVSSTTKGHAVESESHESHESYSTERMIIQEEKTVIELITPKVYGGCPEGMTHGEHGICKETKLSETSTIDAESTTDRIVNKQSEVNLMGCPEGTQRDAEGSCQQIKPFNNTKPVTDPKVLLKPDGSCPDNYKMIEGRCLYIKPKTNSTLSSNTPGENVSNDVRPKFGKDETSQSELVPVLHDNSCPEGTEYSENGLCEKRIRSCLDGTQLINGKCVRKNLSTQSELTTSTSIPESTTPVKRPIDHDELPTTTPEDKIRQ